MKISEIEDIIRKPEEEIHALNDKISQLQTKRDKLQSFVDSHRSLLSPVRRLPRDLLAEIFLQCLPGDRLPIRSIGEAPLLLTTVCHTWREVAITTPRLWRAIHFIFPTLAGYYTLDNHFRSFFKAQKDGLELWLNRSGSVMLTLSCCLPLDAAASSRAVREELRSMYVQLLGTLLRNSTRWKSFYLNGFPADMLSTMHDLKAEDIPHLDSLFLQGNGLSLIASPTVPEVPDSPYHNIARAPSLRVLHILYTRVDPFTLPVRWNGLTDLTLCNNVMRGTQSIPQSDRDDMSAC
ncbi:hypothetical protein VNI00_003166 [Paramarasmius palmivorus]|uniref:F-box domain-containing protein n=1 Tax=Paramarasmius palmivorus TaxID=297713 RepID=A0AAW0DPX8_9AGAR